MIIGLIQSLGPWSWVIFGAALLAAEIALPGNFLIWVGLAAAAIGAVSLAVWDAGWWSWEIQWLAFAALSCLFLFVGRGWLHRRGGDSDEPLLNRRAQSLVGRMGDLIDPIHNGFGRVKLGDTIWVVKGPDLPAGTKVRVIGADGADLVVEAG